MSEHTSTWTWPEGRVLILYHWSWADGTDEAGQPRLVHGWSRMGAVDANRYIHLEAEQGRPAESLWVDPDGYPAAHMHTFLSIASLPHELRTGDMPLQWVRTLLDTGR